MWNSLVTLGLPRHLNLGTELPLPHKTFPKKCSFNLAKRLYRKG